MCKEMVRRYCPRYENRRCDRIFICDTNCSESKIIKNILKDNVIITREEYDSLANSEMKELVKENKDLGDSLYRSCELSRKLLNDKKSLKQELEQEHRKTVEEFINLLTDNGKRQTLDIEDTKGNVYDKAYIIPQSHLEKVAKQLGVEINK